jgi:hypothetical protein
MLQQEALPIVIAHTRCSTDTLQKIAFEELHGLWTFDSLLSISTIAIPARRQQIESQERMKARIWLTVQIRSGHILMVDYNISCPRLLHLDVRSVT